MSKDVILTLRRMRPIAPSSPDLGADYRRIASSTDLVLPRCDKRTRDHSLTDAACENGTLDSIARLGNHAVARSEATSTQGINASVRGEVFAIQRDRSRMAALQTRDDVNVVRHDRTDGCARQGRDGAWHTTDIRPLGREAHKPATLWVKGTKAWNASRSEDQSGWAERSPEDASRDAAASALGNVTERCNALYADLVHFATNARCVDYAAIGVQVAASRRILGDRFEDCVTQVCHAAAFRAKMRKALRHAGVDVAVPSSAPPKATTTR